MTMQPVTDVTRNPVSSYTRARTCIETNRKSRHIHHTWRKTGTPWHYGRRATRIIIGRLALRAGLDAERLRLFWEPFSDFLRNTRARARATESNQGLSSQLTGVPKTRSVDQYARTREAQAPDRDDGASAPQKATRLKPAWQRGQSGNPKGRVKGSRKFFETLPKRQSFLTGDQVRLGGRTERFEGSECNDEP